MIVMKSRLTAQHAILQDLLRQVRLDAGLRQVEMADRLGQPQSFVSKYETGERRLDLVQLRQICAAAGITMEEFVRRFDSALQSETLS
jgi:transcriptional regulator with XRE-family HTH domain